MADVHDQDHAPEALPGLEVALHHALPMRFQLQRDFRIAIAGQVGDAALLVQLFKHVRSGGQKFRSRDEQKDAASNRARNSNPSKLKK